MKKMSPEWLDSEILRLKKEVDKIVACKSFLTNTDDLRLCLFLPKLVAVRYLGFRQKNLLSCRPGKNILFGPGKSVTFHFEPEDFRRRPVDFTISAELHGEIRELLLTIQVLTEYMSKVLDVIRSQDQAHYQEVMGDSFFARAVSRGSCVMIKPYIPVDPGGAVAAREDGARLMLRANFRRDADTFLSGEDEDLDPIDLTPDLVRHICLDWMHRILGIPQEEIQSLIEGRRSPFFNNFNAGQDAEIETLLRLVRQASDRRIGTEEDRAD